MSHCTAVLPPALYHCPIMYCPMSAAPAVPAVQTLHDSVGDEFVVAHTSLPTRPPAMPALPAVPAVPAVQTLHDTVWDEFVVAHTLGWWGKALIIRNHTML